MKLTSYIWLFIIICSCKSAIVQEDSQEDSQKIFENHLKAIERLFNGEKIYTLKTTILFLEEITSVESDINYGVEIMYNPTEQNLKDWKDWYKKNKKRLYWDEKEQKVKVRELNKSR